MKNGWFEAGGLYWQSKLIEKVWIGKTTIEVWFGNKQKYVFFSKEEEKDPGYMTIEAEGLSRLEFNKLKVYFEELIGINEKAK